MKICKHRNRRSLGMTLIEVTMMMTFGMALASSALILLNQQTTFQRKLAEQDFLLRDAPQINRSLTAILGKAFTIRLYSTFDDALDDMDGSAPVVPILTDSTILGVAFREVDGSLSYGVITFEDDGAGNTELNYYYYDPSGGGIRPTFGTPSWTMSRRVTSADFDLLNGIFTINLGGPNLETISYAISPNQ